MNDNPKWLHRRNFLDETVVIFGQGPSFNAEDAIKLSKPFYSIAIKDTFRYVPNALIVYASDKSWWIRTWAKDDGIKQHTGVRVCLDYERTSLDIPEMKYLHSDGIHGFSYKEGMVKHGGNSGHQAINLALNLGAKRIILLGFDMCVVKKKTHFDNCPHVPVPHDVFTTFRQELVLAVQDPAFVRKGVKIVNCSLDSALKCFPKMPVDEAIKWGMTNGQ